MQAVFTFGVRTALSILNNRQKDIEIYPTYARRGTLQEKRAGGSRVQSAPMRTIFEEDVTFNQACQEIAEYQTQIFSHANVNTVELISMHAKAYGCKGMFASYAPMVFTFQPMKLTLADGTPLRTKWFCNGCTSSVNYLTIMDANGTGALRCYHEYQKHTVKPERLRLFHDLMVKSLLAGARNPDITLGEILDAAGGQKSASEEKQQTA
jgi:hypothetical protein